MEELLEDTGGAIGLNLTAVCNPNFSLSLLKQYNYAYTVSSMVTLVLAVGLLAAMVFYREYRTTLQRMVIYLTLTIMVYFVTSSLSIELQPSLFHTGTGEVLCQWVGYIQVSANISSLVLSLEISVYFLFMMWYQVKGKPLPVPTRSQTIALELVGLFVGVVIPPCLLAVKIDYYGVGGAICWIKIYANSNCNDTREIDTLGVATFVVYTTFISINLIAYALLVTIFLWLGCKFQQSKAQYMKTARRTIILMVLFVVYTVVQLGSVVIVHYMIKRRLYMSKGMLVLCVLMPLSQLMRPVAFIYYLNSIKKFRWQVAKSKAGQWRNSWQLCCLRFRHWASGKKGGVMINNLEARSSDFLTPSLVSSSRYDSLSRTAVQ